MLESMQQLDLLEQLAVPVWLLRGYNRTLRAKPVVQPAK